MKKWNLMVRAISIFVGVMLSFTLIYIVQKELNWNILLGASTAVFLLIVINVIKNALKKDLTPDTDERTVQNVLRFFSFSSHILLGILFTALSVISFMGMESVSISYLWIILIGYLWFVGIGAFIVSRR